MTPITRFKFHFAFLCAISLFFISCGNNDENGTTTTTDTTVTDTAGSQTASQTSSIDTTGQNIVVVRYTVSDYEKWRSSYDSRDSMRTANGLHNFVLGRGVKNPKEIMVAVKADDMEKAKSFSKAGSLKSALQKGYVVGTPKYNFTRVTYLDMSPNISDLRSMSFFTVKDWETWKAAYESGRQIREQNGVTDRAYGHEVDNNRKVIVVVAVNDSAKAEAFWKSDVLKQRREAAGVEGKVERFVYRVVQQY